MNTNRRSPQTSRRAVRMPRINEQDAIVAGDAIVLKVRARRIPQAPGTRALVNVTPSADEGLGAICLGEH